MFGNQIDFLHFTCRFRPFSKKKRLKFTTKYIRTNGLFHFTCHFQLIFQRKSVSILQFNLWISDGFSTFLTVFQRKLDWVFHKNALVGITWTLSFYLLIFTNFSNKSWLKFTTKCLGIKWTFFTLLAIFDQFSSKKKGQIYN